MSNTLIPQTTNPARDLYKFLYSIAKHTSQGDLVDRGNFASVFYFQDGVDLRVVGNWPWMNGKPPLAIGRLMTIWPNGDFVVSVRVRKDRWCNDERRQLARHTFLQWQSYVAYKDKALFVQDHEPFHNCRYHYQSRLNETDFRRNRPYLTCDSTDLLLADMVYRLERVPYTADWKIRAVRPAPEAGRLPKDRVRRLIRSCNERLDLNYQIAERRYARHQRRHEIESWRLQGLTGPPKPVRHQERGEIIRTFIDHSIVFEPKSAPQGELLPFYVREEAMAHG
jgi:hypothetical protein